MTVVLCPDTRKFSPEKARQSWWEIQIGSAPTTIKGRMQGFGPTCSVLSGLTFVSFGSDSRAALAPLLPFLTDERTETFRSEAEARRKVDSLHDALPRALPTLYGAAAMAERSRVWRTG